MISLPTLPWARYRRLPGRPAPWALQQKTACPGCGQVRQEELLRQADFQCFQDREGQNRILHRVVFCLHCGVVYTDPWLTSDGARWLFEKAGASYGHCDPAERVAWVRKRCPDPQTVLDLGCGDGRFLAAFPAPVARIGLEADPHLARLARSRGIDVQEQDVESPGALPVADVITLFHLLEHVTDPLAFLHRLRNRATDTVRLVVEVPVLDRAIETQGPDLCGFYSIPHRTHFSRATLRRMLVQTGWEVRDETDLRGNGYRVLAAPGASPLPVLPLRVPPGERTRVGQYEQVRRASVERIRHRVTEIPETADLVIWGAGHHTEWLDRFTDLFQGARRYLIVDRDPVKSGMTIHGIPVCPPEALPPEFWTAGDFQVLVSSYAWQAAIAADLADLGIPRDRVVTLYPR